jgi:hypothetical protein
LDVFEDIQTLKSTERLLDILLRELNTGLHASRCPNERFGNSAQLSLNLNLFHKGLGRGSRNTQTDQGRHK